MTLKLITKYKIVLYNGYEYLLYKKVYRIWFISWGKWLTIPYPNEKRLPRIICNKIPEHSNVKKFILKYSSIDDYLKTEYVERKKKYH